MPNDERAPEAQEALRRETLRRIHEIADPGSALRESDEVTCYLRPAEARVLAALLSPALPDAPDRSVDLRKRVKRAFLSGYVAAGPCSPDEAEAKAERYAAVTCDPPRLDRVIRPLGLSPALPDAPGARPEPHVIAELDLPFDYANLPKLQPRITPKMLEEPDAPGGEREPEWFDSDQHAEQCRSVNRLGFCCMRPAGHEGPHVHPLPPIPDMRWTDEAAGARYVSRMPDEPTRALRPAAPHGSSPMLTDDDTGE